MSRQQFTSRNDKGQILTFQKSGSTASFDPSIGFSSGSKRVSWRSNNGVTTTQTAGNVLTYTGFTSDTGIRTIEMRGNSFKNINLINFNTDNLYGQLDLTPLSGLGGSFQVYINPLLTGITHSPSTQSFTQYWAFNCDLTGNLDLTPLSGLGGEFIVAVNPLLTGITHSPSTQSFTQYYAYNCNLTGNLDLTPLSGLGGEFRVQSNVGLTGITHANSSNSMTNYTAHDCNLIGNLDLTPLSGLGGNFQIFNNPLLTGVTHSISPNNFTQYDVSDCNLIGNLDLTPLSGLGGIFTLANNTNLTGITNPTSIRNFTEYSLNICGLIGVLDLTPLSNFGGVSSASTCIFGVSSNSFLSGVTFPVVNTFFKNVNNNDALAAFRMFQSNLDYVDFKPLSGATLMSGTTQGAPRIALQNNNMSTTDVNHILVDFSGNATYNQTGWSNINLNISGTNGAPDSSSGGYDGLSAISFLTGSPYNWTITYT
jgi:hypothetical protein